MTMGPAAALCWVPVSVREAGLSEAMTVEVVDEHSLSIFTITGSVLVDEIVRVILTHFPEHRSDNSVWDLTEADLSVLTKDGIERIVEAGRAVAPYRRADGRTAMVVQKHTERVLLKVYKAVNELQGAPRPLRFFDTRADAIAWIRDGVTAGR